MASPVEHLGIKSKLRSGWVEMYGDCVFFAWADLPPVPASAVVPVMMICSFVLLVVFALLAHRLIVRELRKSREQLAESRPPSSTASLFDAPTRWLAIRTTNTRLVQQTLALQNARACAWSDALTTPFEPRLFISPPVRGWTLVMGCDLPDPADDVDDAFLFLTQLSQQLGEVQFFMRNRAVSFHGWAHLDQGKVHRAYAWAGGVLWNQGARTEAERNLKLRCLAYTESADVLGLAENELLSLNTERVIRLAALWSLDPTAVEATVFEAKGIAGDLLHSKFH